LKTAVNFAVSGQWTVSEDGAEVELKRRQPSGWVERVKVSKTVFDSARQHPVIRGTVKTAEIGPDSTASVHIVQLTTDRNEDLKKRDAADNAVIASIANELEQRGQREKAERLRLCGVFRGRRQCLKCDHKAEPEIYCCGMWRLCPRCARIRAQKLRAELEDAVRNVPQVSGNRWKMLTLTLKTDGDYRNTIRLMNGAFTKLYNGILKWRWIPLEDGAAVKRRADGRYFCGKVRVYPGRDGEMWRRLPVVGCGGFRSNEFGELTGNVHAHVLLYAPRIPQAVISAEWLRLTGSMVVDIRQIRGKKDKGTELTLADGVSEVVKYCCKVSAVEPSRLLDFWNAMRGSRMTQRYGVLLGAMRSEEQILTPACECCGGTRYRWNYVSFAEAKEFHLRGPPN
jgi:hypothetical protein